MTDEKEIESTVTFLVTDYFPAVSQTLRNLKEQNLGDMSIFQDINLLMSFIAKLTNSLIAIGGRVDATSSGLRYMQKTFMAEVVNF